VHPFRDVTASKEIEALVRGAWRSDVSAATVRNHFQRILEKLDVHSRLEAAACAARHRIG
jgi:hypothetical protein